MFSEAYSTILRCIHTRVPAATTGHRSTQRVNAAILVAQQAAESGQQLVGSINPITLIPVSFTQMLNSGYAVFRSDTLLTEKFIQGLEALFSAVTLGLSITLVFDNNEIITQLINLFQLLYNALLLISWGGSEMAKDHDASRTNTVGSTPRVIIVANTAKNEEGKRRNVHENDEQHENDVELLVKRP